MPPCPGRPASMDPSRKHLQVITNSEVEDFRKCRAFWGYRYPEGLRATEEAAPLSYGDLYHKGAAAGWRMAWANDVAAPDRLLRAGKGAWAAVELEFQTRVEALRVRASEHLEEQLGEQEEQRDTARWALAHYLEVRQLDLQKVPLAIEAPFQVPIPNAAGQAAILRQEGVLDLLLWDPDSGLLQLQDHKTTGDNLSTVLPKLPLNTQMSGYVLAVRRMIRNWDRGLLDTTTPAARLAASNDWSRISSARVGAIAFNVSRRAVPNEPKVNLLKLTAKAAALDTPIARLVRLQENDKIPRGEVSVAACDTTARVYRAALEEQEIGRCQPITDKQREFLAALERQGDRWFQHLEFYRGEEELERWRQEMWTEAKLMREAERDPRLRTRNPHACTGPASPKCVYAAVCLNPSDPVARAEFRTATARHEEVAEAMEHGGQRTRTEGRSRSIIGPSPGDPF